VSGLRARLAATFLAPPSAAAEVLGSRSGREPSPSATPERVVVLARPGDAWAAGGAVALGASSKVAVVAAWGAGPPPGLQAPGSPAVRRLAARLVDRGHAARASGRLVLISLDGDAGAATAEAAGIAAAAGDAMVVTVFAGSRDEHVDAALADGDRVIVAAAGPNDAVAALTAEGIPVAELIDVAARTTARALAACGVARLGSLRAGEDAERP
jgi:hypothetical protein